MRTSALRVTDRTDASPAIDFITDKLSACDTRLLDWIRIYPMTAKQHQPQITGDLPPVTLSVCWPPRDSNIQSQTPRSRHMYRIKVNIWQGGDYPAIERDWGRVPARPIRRRSIEERFTTRGICEWSYPDRLTATVHALTRAIFHFLAHSRQIEQSFSKSNASAMGHSWTVEWLRENRQKQAAEAMSTQLVQWRLIQSKGI